jgi:anti-sigma factor RsiW
MVYEYGCGELSAEAMRVVEQHLAQCAEYRSLAHSLTGLRSGLHALSAPLPCSDEFMASVMSRITPLENSPAFSWRSFMNQWCVPSAAIAALLLIVYDSALDIGDDTDWLPDEAVEAAYPIILG